MKCPKCGEENSDNWPVTVGGKIVQGGCQDCWEKECADKLWQELNSLALHVCLSEILQELERSMKKHPVYPDYMGNRVRIVAEEEGELMKAVNEHLEKGASLADIRKEAIHTAASALRFLVNLPDPEKRKPVEYHINAEG